MADFVVLGDRAIRFARPTGVSPAAIVREVRAWPDVIDVVVAADDIAAYFATTVTATSELDTAIRALALAHGELVTPREIELHATYDGPDLDDIARSIGIDRAEMIRLHANTTYTVETIGFAPGFAYLAGLHPRLALPRRATPRPRVPAGSLAIAGLHTAVYPFASPGGWNLIGRVEEEMFGGGGALLRFGDRVRFVEKR